MGSNGDLT
uniref:Uncharacterized protein n=1 Tax=Anguilla anguilla TaxID=7936 RepID=A0A0E9SGF9_ANGAN